MQNVQILIVSAVKICKQCLQTSSAFRVLRGPQTSYRGFTPGPHWGTFVPQAPWAIAFPRNCIFWCRHWLSVLHGFAHQQRTRSVLSCSTTSRASTPVDDAKFTANFAAFFLDEIADMRCRTATRHRTSSESIVDVV